MMYLTQIFPFDIMIYIGPLQQKLILLKDTFMLEDLCQLPKYINMKSQ